jgi:orotidine-5'-phosphate decarboxylase
MLNTPAKNRLMVAIDVATPEEARLMVARLDSQAGVLKIGLELIFAGGIPLVEEFKSQGYQVFLDAKLFDIPNTVKGAVGSVLRFGADYLTVHAYPQNVAAALEAAQGSSTTILGVTVLTSMAGDDLIKAGYETSDVAQVVETRVKNCMNEGLNGFVASPHEASAMRSILGKDGLIVTPGVRPANAELGDQKRVMTPFEAIKAGASHLVVGRPITRAQTPASSASAIVTEIERALSA